VGIAPKSQFPERLIGIWLLSRQEIWFRLQSGRFEQTMQAVLEPT